MRCHDSTYGATEFNPDAKISQRFRPFTARRRTVPTLYGSRTVAGALSETLFHAVPVDGPDRKVRLSRLDAWQISHLAPMRALQLADLTDPNLEAIEMAREELIESPAIEYPRTAEWAQALFHCPLQPDGLVWNARQGRKDLALVLFQRGRVRRQDLEIVKPPVPMAVGRGAELAYAAAEDMEITLVG